VKRKSRVALVILIVVFSSCIGQNFTPRIGFVFASAAKVGFPRAESIKIKERQGITAGLGYNIKIDRMFSIQTELNFIQKGFTTIEKGQYEFNYPYGSREPYVEETTYYLRYLELPVLAKFTFGHRIKFYVDAGPSVAIGLAGKTKEQFTSVHLNRSDFAHLFFGNGKGYGTSQTVGEFEHKLEYCFQIGAGAIFFQNIQIEIRYGRGFTDLNNSLQSRLGHSLLSNAQNRVLQFSLGVPLKLVIARAK
jgi:hypothetical protein